MTLQTYSKLTPMQQKILKFLAQNDAWHSRQDMYEFVGKTKGYSAALGAPRGADHPNSRETLGLVERQGEKQFKYRISPHGRSILAEYEEGKSVAPFLPEGPVDMEAAG